MHFGSSSSTNTQSYPTFTAFLVLSAALVFARSRGLVSECSAAESLRDASAAFTVEIEAEAGDVTAPMTIADHAGASGGRCVRSTDEKKGSVTLAFRVPTDGDYVIWARLLGEGRQANASFVSIDDGHEEVFELPWIMQTEWRAILVRGRGTANERNHANPYLHPLRAGVHRITFRGARPGTLLDRIAISNDRAFVMARSANRKNTSSAPAEAPSRKYWWSDQVNVVTWGLLHQETDPRWAAFAEETGATIMDRGFRFPRPSQVPPEFHQECQRAAQAIHARGWKLNSFRTIMDWDPSPEPLAQAIDSLKKHIDDGCDGVHLDWFNTPKTTEGAPAAARQIREELRRYGREKYGREVMFAGNIWSLIEPSALEMAPQMDVVWIESWGDSDVALVRIARMATAAGCGRPVWYHWQPNDDHEWQVQKLGNLSRALFSSCLMENAVFLCNYKYPVCVKGVWEFFYVTPVWEQNVLRYSKFVRQYRDYYIGAQPQAAVLVAFHPSYLASAAATMQTLLEQGISFNVLIHGGEVFPAAQLADTQGYAAVITPGWGPLPPSDRAKRFDSAEAFLRDVPPEVGAFLTIEQSPKVLGRVMTKGHYRILHLKQTGYTDKTDSLPRTSPLKVTMLAPGVTRGFVASPDGGEESPLQLEALDGGRVVFTVPGIEYYSLVVLK